MSLEDLYHLDNDVPHTIRRCTLYRVALKHLISSKMPLETLQFVLSGFCFDRTQTTEESNLETVVGNLSSLLRLRLPDGVILTQRCIDQLARLTNLQKLDMYSHKVSCHALSIHMAIGCQCRTWPIPGVPSNMSFRH